MLHRVQATASSRSDSLVNSALGDLLADGSWSDIIESGRSHELLKSQDALREKAVPSKCRICNGIASSASLVSVARTLQAVR